jgi:hypothetical protein
MTPLQHVIKITAHISWEGRANGLPEEVSAYVIYTGENPADVNAIIEAEISTFARYQMMFVQRDQGQVIDIRLTPQDRIGIPFHWIVNFSITVSKLGAELSEANEEGLEVFQDGSKPRVN